MIVGTHHKGIIKRQVDHTTCKLFHKKILLKREDRTTLNFVFLENDL